MVCVCVCVGVYVGGGMKKEWLTFQSVSLGRVER